MKLTLYKGEKIYWYGAVVDIEEVLLTIENVSKKHNVEHLEFTLIGDALITVKRDVELTCLFA